MDNCVQTRKESQILIQSQTQKIIHGLILFVPWMGRIVIGREQKGTFRGAGNVPFLKLVAPSMAVFSL